MSSQKVVSYFDSSVILRHAIGHENCVNDLHRFSLNAITSSIAIVECFRVLDRWKITKEISDDKLVSARSLCVKILNGLRILSVDEAVITIASQSFPIALKSLDAIHLASAMALQKYSEQNVLMLTHDKRLQMAAESVGIETLTL